MNDFQSLYETYMVENDMDVYKIGIFPGAFKPPHTGHYHTALNACKDCDEVHIFVSAKERALTTQNKVAGPEAPDSDRYKNLIHSDKFTNNIFSVSTAGVARMTSASALRAAISIKDKNTIFKNLPEGSDKETIFNILMQSNDVSNNMYGHISIDQTMAIWEQYATLLVSNNYISPDKLHVNISQTSPVRDTYELVESINNSEQASGVAIKLYVGE